MVENAQQELRSLMNQSLLLVSQDQEVLFK
jgi:hypothetical protein